MSISMNVNFIHASILKPKHKKDCILVVQSMLNPDSVYVCLGFYSENSKAFHNLDTGNRISDNVLLWLYESDMIPKDIRRQIGYVSTKSEQVENFRKDFAKNSIKLKGATR